MLRRDGAHLVGRAHLIELGTQIRIALNPCQEIEHGLKMLSHGGGGRLLLC